MFKDLELSHYDYLDKYWHRFAAECGANTSFTGGIVTCHGDKGYSYKDMWERNNIPFNHGMMLFLLHYVKPFSKDKRILEFNRKNFESWCIETYKQFVHLMPIEESNE